MYRVQNIYTGEVMAKRLTLAIAVRLAKGCSYEWQVRR